MPRPARPFLKSTGSSYDSYLKLSSENWICLNLPLICHLIGKTRLSRQKGQSIVILCPSGFDRFKNFGRLGVVCTRGLWSARAKNHGYHFPIPTVFFDSRPISILPLYSLLILWKFQDFKQFFNLFRIHKRAEYNCPSFRLIMVFLVVLVFPLRVDF